MIKRHLFYTTRIDVKENRQIGKPLLIHKKGSKVVGLHCNPVDSDVFISCGNDHMVSNLVLFIELTGIYRQVQMFHVFRTFFNAYVYNINTSICMCVFVCMYFCMYVFVFF